MIVGRAATAAGLKVIGASAGSGKTYCLTREVLGAVTATGRARVPLEGLVAVTYTRRAHAELESRIRQALLAADQAERGARLPRAYVGTVHSVCLRWLREFALEAGLSPTLDVLLNDQAAIREALEGAVSKDDEAELQTLASRLEIGVDHRKGRVDWITPTRNIITLARHGRIRAESLEAMAKRSVCALLSHFPPPARNGGALDRRLREAIESARVRLQSTADLTKKTAAARDLLRNCRASFAGGWWTWTQWLQLSQLDVAKSSLAAVEPLRAAASVYERHPGLRRDLERFTVLVFRVAARALERYRDWKAERGLVDYVDMIDHALDVLDDPAVRDDVSDRLRFVVVDEMQDSSPVQLALFLKLHRLAGRSSWVGDPKQCIFEYAGADPALMDAVLGWAAATGGGVQRLDRNWRSRPELTELCSALFASAFATHGIKGADVVVRPTRSTPSRLAKLPALGLFYLESPNLEGDAVAVANGVKRLLDEPEKTPVVDPASSQVRGASAGDVAVVVSTNLEAERIADALAALGIRATLARTGLLSTPEGVALAAALGYLLDRRDELAIATLEALEGFGHGGADAWLERKLRTATARDKDAAAGPQAAQLDRIRSSVASASPTELVDAVFVALDFTTLAARWPNAPQRLANLESLRNFARLYEQRCHDEGDAASLAGLLRFLQGLEEAVYRNGEERAADEQHAGSDRGAVTVITYHRCKGLEWPIVILCSLDRAPRRNAFDVLPEDERKALNPDEPLGGRWIRYWPPPFGARNAPLYDRIEASPVGRRVRERERRERARLLYVGFTRARDHLVLAARLNDVGTKTQWLDELTDTKGRQAIELPSLDASPKKVRIRRATGGILMAPVRAWRLSGKLVEVEPVESPRLWFARPGRETRPDYRVAPSSAREAGLTLPTATETTIVVVHPPLRQGVDSTVERSAVGDAIHAFLAADNEGLTYGERLARAEACLLARRASGSYAGREIVAAADAFRAFVAMRAPNATWHREIPVEARVLTEHGERTVDGRIDLLLETDDGLILVDHKSFPGIGEDAWREKAIEFLPQLGAYALALERAAPKKVVEVWLHFTVSGAVWVGQLNL